MRLTSNHKKSLLPSIIQPNIPLNDKNWFRTGGPARYFSEPSNNEEFQIAVHFAQTNKLPLFILGTGANILISDDGFDGLVIRPALHMIEMTSGDTQTALVTAGSGVQLDNLIEQCLNQNLIGLEEFSGIPGTVGGAVYINLHYFNFLLEHFLVSAQVIEKKTGTISTVDKSWFNFGYNQSTLQQGTHLLLNATFKLKNARYPQKGTCGSFFRNFHENEVSIITNDKKMIYVAYYLDKIGVKGALQIGDAVVSHQHANMLVNRGNATTANLIELARSMQALVKKKFGILPQPECRLIGFNQYPLLQEQYN